MRKIVFLLFIFVALATNSQTVPKKFSQLSCSIKTWVILHPFKAKKAQLISIEANRVSDSIKKSNLLDSDDLGGQVDAFRHGYWMARLRQEIGRNAALSLGKSYEKANQLQFKKGKLEEGVLPDKISSEMDLFNNKVGVSLISKNSKTPKTGLIYRVVNSILAGEMKVVKKDKKGRFIDCNGSIISATELFQNWENKKCLVPSNQSFK